MYGTESVAPAAGELVRRAPFKLGATLVNPATRELLGPAGLIAVPPRVMQLLLELVDAGGAVVTRDLLALRCWGGRFVAEDSLNSAVGDLRRALRTVAGDAMTIETVPRTGYRFVGAEPTDAAAVQIVAPTGFAVADAPLPRVSRRTIVTGSVAAIALAGFGVWRSQPNTDVSALIERGTQAMRDGLPNADAQGVVFLKEAVARAPDNAAAWGKLALAWRGVVVYGDSGQTAAAVDNAEAAARRALAIDPRQSDALAALAALVPIFGDWTAAERRIRAVLAVDADNLYALGMLSTLFMSVGRVADSGRMLDQLVERDPLSADRQFRRVYTLWSRRRLAEMDHAADRALQLRPRHPAVWFVRFWTLLFTGRASAARAMLDDVDGRPPMPPPALELLRISARALATREVPDVQKAIDANLRAASSGPGPATGAIMVLSALDAVDAAFDVAQGFMMRRGPVIVQLRHTPVQASITDLHHRMTMMLWVPATSSLRADARFPGLCSDIGLVDYWRQARRLPDYLGGRPLPS